MPTSTTLRRWRPRALRLALLAILCLAAGRPPAPVVELGPQQQVTSINPRVGIHTRLTDEVEPWKVKRTLEMVREMGAGWIVEYFPWAYSEPAPGRYDWTHADQVVDHARRQGLQVIARLGLVPEWARPGTDDRSTTPTYLDVEYYPAFAQYAQAFVGHFRERVAAIVVWNEPNIALEWGYRPVDPEGYTALLSATYAAVKQADPKVVVLGGALAPTLAPSGDPEGMNDLEYLQRMLAAGAGEAMDGLAVHAYGWKLPPDAPADPATVNFARTELLHAMLVDAGYPGMPVYLTEGGWNDHPRWTKAVLPGQRAAFTVRAYQKAEQEWPWCEVVALWAFRYPRPANSYLDYFTFVTPDFTPKPVYTAVQEYARGGEQ
ncbi:MAG TPA: beta-galactosidase [Anaerolineae bacterium]|nr:beta-galactosidase [Anaerolineae bacterium]